MEKTYKECEKNGLQISSYFDVIIAETQAEDDRFIFKYNKNIGV